jgi:hypothetical protein
LLHVTALTLTLALAGAASPGLYFEQTTTVFSQGRSLGPGVRSRVWHAEGCLRLEAGDVTGGPALVLCPGHDRGFRLDAERRIAVRLDLARLRERSQGDAAVAGGLMGGGDESAVRTRAVAERRTIAGHPCRGFVITGPSVQMTVWVAEDLGVGIDTFAEFLDWSGAGAALGGLLSAIRGLPGFPLETDTQVDVFGEVKRTLSTVTAIRVGPQPARLFEVPAGYSVVEEGSGATDRGGPR